MLRRVSALALATLAASAISAQAAPIDLTSLIDTSGNPVSVPELSISTPDAAEIFVGGAPIFGSQEVIFCALGSNCDNDVTLTFTTPSSNVSFSVGDQLPAGAIETIEVSAFDSLSMLLGTVEVTSADLAAGGTDSSGISQFTVDLSGFGTISEIRIADQNTPATGGFFYYDVNATPIPLPAALPLMALGLGALGIARSRKRKAV
ncbi:VPLPA-CTERM sorting domain-containing protein [Dinoroseobacter sp. S124A]|uniref:VPLPA-CTERM sorting domain-containing protein n=1 Tax=Dinoroseobacter sp. S124A TaxID=3415128 RepID=UPI003C7DA1DD